MTTYTADRYIQELQARQAAYEVEHPPQPGREWVRPLLEWFIHDDDQVDGVTVNQPARPPAPVEVKRDRRPEIRARLQRNLQRLAVVTRRLAALDSGGGDGAVVNLSPRSRSRPAARAGCRRMAQLDRDIQRAASLLDTRDALTHKVTLDEHRLATLDQQAGEQR